MKKGKTLQRMLGVSLLAMMFGTGAAYAQLGQENSAGKTPRNQENKMSITGQNATSSASPPEVSGSSASSGSSTSSGSSASGSAPLGQENSAGMTPRNEEGKMSITGQNATSSASPPETSGSSTSGSSASGSKPLEQENSAGKTPSNEEGKMSITGQNATSSASPPETSGSSSSTGAAAAGSSMESKSSGSSAASSKSKSAGASEVSKSDQNMMKELSYANMAEIEAAQMAMEKSQDVQVQKFAKQMIEDHTKAHEQLRELADAKQVTLPMQLDKKHKSEVQKLSKLSGDKFDKKYLSQGGVVDHRQAAKLLDRIEKNAKDEQLKTLASSLSPTINQHWEMAKQMKSANAGTQPPSTGMSGTTGAAKSGAGTESK